MKRVIPVLMALLLLAPTFVRAAEEVKRREEGNLVIEGIPEIPQRVIDRMFQYQNTRGAGVSGWSADGSGIYIGTRFGETSQIHFVKKPGGARTQITFFNEPVSGAAVCPNRLINGFLFGKDVGGGEFYQIFWFSVPTAKYTLLTDGKSRNGGFSWSNTGDRFVYYTTKRNGRDWDLYVSTVEKPEEAVPVLEEGGVWFPMDWSPDDSKLLVGRYVSANESYGYVLDMASGELGQMNPSEKKIAYGGSIWSADGKGIFFSSDEDTEFKHLRYYDLEKKKQKVLTKNIKWDVEGISVSHDRRTLAFTTNEDGITKLYLMDTGKMKYDPVEGFPVGSISGLAFSPDDTKLALTISTPSSTGDVYVLNLTDRSIERWTYSEIGGLDSDSFVRPELFHYDTFDKIDGKQRKIPAFIFKPVKGEGPYPVVINIHGGPESQYTPHFSAGLQYMINDLGITVISPNVRGSSGYGKSYLKLDNWEKREDSVKDIGSLIDWIEKQPDLDKSRVCVYGGSYGGYMVYASMIHYNDRLKCGIDVVGISNFVTFLENTKEYRRDLRRVEYGDERDPEMRAHLKKISPTTNAYKITRPMLIIQGFNDPRVPASEAEQMLDAIRENGGEAWYLLAMDEGHGFRKKSNRDYMMHSMMLFLEEYLLE